jgi:hypothetical protein
VPALLLAGACGERKASAPPAPPAAAAPSRATPAASGRAGLDSAAVDRYLATVDTVTGATVKVTWAPGSVILDRARTRATLREVSADGTRFTLVRGDPALDGLKPGAVFLLWGIALRRVESVATSGDRLVVETGPVPLNEAMPDAEIHWNAPVNYAQGRFGRAAPKPDTTTHAMGRVPRRSPYQLAAFGVPQEGAPAEGSGDEPAIEQFEHSIASKSGKYEYELGFLGGDVLVFQLETAREGEEGGDEEAARGALDAGLAEQDKRREKAGPENEWGFEVEQPFAAKLTKKGLFGAAKDLYDLRLRVDGRLSGFRTQGDLSIANAVARTWTLTIDRLNGQFWADFILRLGAKGVFSENLKVEIPYRFTVPMIIAGIPFVADFGMGFLAAPALTSHHATISGRVHVAFDGSEKVEASGSDFTASHDVTAGPDFKWTDVTTMGVSGMVVAVQAPRVGLGLGLIGTSGVGYVDQVLAWSVVAGGAVSMVPCRRYQLDSSMGAGVDMHFLGFKVPKLSTERKQVAKLFERTTTEPPGVNCKVDEAS